MKQTLTNALPEHHLVTSMHVVLQHPSNFQVKKIRSKSF